MPINYSEFPSPAICLDLSAAFFARAEREFRPEPLLPGSLPRAAEKFAEAVGRLLKAPPSPGAESALRLAEEREPLRLGTCDPGEWLRNFGLALRDVGIDDPLHGCLVRLFGALSLREDGRDRDTPGTAQARVSELWAEQRLMAELACAVQTLDIRRALELVREPAAILIFERDRAGLLMLLTMMCASGNPALLEFVRAHLLSDPQLARDRYRQGRTLLHGAAEAGCLEIVGMLLRCGAEPNEIDEAWHNAVFCCASHCAAPGGPNVIRALVMSGARVDTPDRTSHCTPLHMAARRGSVGIGAALIDCGAKLEARDAAGDTPLRRAVDGGRIHVAEMLAERGADVYSVGSGGLTVLEAAKSERMQGVLVDSSVQGLKSLSRRLRSGGRAGSLAKSMAAAGGSTRPMPRSPGLRTK